MSIFKKVGRFVMKFNPGSVVIRNSFLGLVKLNFAGIAGKMYQAGIGLKNSPVRAKFVKFWKAVGGNPDSLLKAVKVGVKKPIRKGKLQGGKFNYDGFDAFEADTFAPAGVGAAIVAATPLLIKALDILKQAGVKTDDLESAVKNEGDAAAEEMVKQGIKDGGQLGIDPNTGLPIVTVKAPKGAGLSDGASGFTWVIVGALAVGALLIFKRK